MTQSKITNTKDIAARFVKILVHGPAGSGKTRLCGTTGGKPLIISAEAGLLSLKGQDLDVWEIKSIDDLREVYGFLLKDNTYNWICIDSISEIAEVCLAEEKKINKDPRKAYGEMQDTITELVRAFRDLPKNIYMSAKQERVKDEMTGIIMYGPSAPGQKISASLPYFFDEVFALHNYKNESGETIAAMQTKRDSQYEAKDRSGALDMAEPADLSVVYNKIIQTKQGE